MENQLERRYGFRPVVKALTTGSGDYAIATVSFQ